MDGKLFTYDDEQVNEEVPVTCLGITFENDTKRREYFREELRKKLPELRRIEGFPIGEDDDIIALSDPPYYTACPNPWINDFIKEWETEKVKLQAEGKRKADFEVKLPYAQGIKVRKNHPIYNAHSYHTKVPHEIIMKYFLHYTQPGDIIVDSFGGTGMTGVAANELDNPASYHAMSEEFPGAKWGYRNCILGDLSPIASFITHNYTASNDSGRFKKAADKIYRDLYDQLSWMYTTKDKEGIGEANYYIWSEVQICPYCGESFTYWDAAVDFEHSKVCDSYKCPHCQAFIKKKESKKYLETYYDDAIGEAYPKVKYEPVIVNYTINGKRRERRLNEYDKEVISRINSTPYSDWFPKNKMMGVGEKWGDTWRAGYHAGYNHVHNFYTRRNLLILSRFHTLIENYSCGGRLKSYLWAWFTSSLSRLHVMNRYAANHHRHVGPLANTLYISGTPAEISPFYFVKSKISDNEIDVHSAGNVVNQIASASTVNLPDNIADYIFTDPPFGGNIMYSELNYITESWLKVFTNNNEEAITSESQNKGIAQYQDLMHSCFNEYYRILKPNRWMTVEFSNTSAAIWNAIQQAIQQAGFVIASVTDLNKGRGGLHGIYNDVAVNQDLAISCYKPSDNISKAANDSYTTSNAWDFVEDFLEHLPVHVVKDNSTTAVIERSPKILFDRLISFYVQRGLSIPMDAPDFQKGLKSRFVERDGMYFTAKQAIEYEEKRKDTTSFDSLFILIGSEAEGIEWLNRKLQDGPKTYSEISNDWMQDLIKTKKGDKLPELMQILDENFLKDENGYWHIPDINDQAQLDAVRNKRLLKEFEIYVEAKKIKNARLEALRAGFKECYKNHDFATIVSVGNKLPEELLTTDEVLLRFYDIASSRV